MILFVNMMAHVGKRAMLHLLLFRTDALIKFVYIMIYSD